MGGGEEGWRTNPQEVRVPKPKSKRVTRRRRRKAQRREFERSFSKKEPKLFEALRYACTGRDAERWKLVDVLRSAGYERPAEFLQYWEGDFMGAFHLARQIIREREERAREKALKSAEPRLLISRHRLTIMQQRRFDAHRMTEIIRLRPLRPPGSSA